MFKKFMAKIGVGAAKVDLVLDKREYALGEVIQGEFRIQGGAVEQKINHLEADLHLRMNIKGKEFTHKISSIPVASSSTIQAGEPKVLPFTYLLPTNIPISRGGVSYYVVSRLDIAAGLDNLDKDYFQVSPPIRFVNMIRALELLGIREKSDSGRFNGYTQEFEFFPTMQFRDKLKEMEFEAAIEDDGIRLLLELDMPSLPFGLGEKELKREVFFTNAELDDVQTLAGKWQDIIEEMLQNPQAYPASYYSRNHPQTALGHRKSHGSGLAGAMGGFAAGMLGGILLDELLSGDDAIESAAETGSNADDGDFSFGDFFGGDDEE